LLSLQIHVFLSMLCPHCQTPIKQPPSWADPRLWHCSHCGGPFGIGETKPYRIPSDFKPRSPLYSESIARRWAFYAQHAYVYALCCPDGIPFYIGSGIRDRVLQHADELRRIPKDQWTEKHRVIERLQSRNKHVWYHFFGLFRDREEAYLQEYYYVELFGLRTSGGLLTNLSLPRRTKADFPLTHEREPRLQEVFHQGETIRLFEHCDCVIAHPSSTPTALHSTHCPGCGIKGHYSLEMFSKKILCPQCGHFFAPYQTPARKPSILRRITERIQQCRLLRR
jgi:hypothetical protein